MPIDRYSSFTRSSRLPASSVREVTPNDAADLASASIALSVATPGTVRVTTLDGDTVDVYVAAGVAFPLRVTRVWATGTNATGIRALS
jgi:hypothetical protein